MPTHRGYRRAGALAFAGVVALSACTSGAGAATSATPNADRILFARWGPSEDRSKAPRMWSVNIDGTEEAQVGDQRGWYMEWGHDRTYFVFDHDDNSWRIDLDGTNLRQLTEDDPAFEYSADPDVSPDGATIVFDRTPRDEFRLSIWLMDSDGGNPRLLLEAPTGEHKWEPAFSPDGTQIVFTHEVAATEESAVFIVDADGQNERRLTPYAIYTEHPRVSPDGETVIYNIEYVRNLEDPRNGIWTVPTTGGEPTQLLPSDSRFHVFKPDYSPDGSRIVFGCLDREQGQEDICVMDADGTDVQKVTDTPDFENHPVWR